MQSLSYQVTRMAILALLGIVLLSPDAASAHDALVEQIAAVTARIARDPTNPELFLRRGELNRAARQWKQSLADLDRADELDPTLVAVDLVRSHVFFESGRHQAAVEAATRFLTHRPGHVDAFVVRGRARARLGQSREAALDFTRALDQRPTPDLYIERARTLRADGAAGIEDALRGLDEITSRLGGIVTIGLEAIDLEAP